MKRKNLLNESQVRKFMKLANINNDMADNFLAETSAGLADQGANKDDTATAADAGPHKNTKVTDAALASQGPGLVKEEEFEDEEVLDDLPGDEGPLDDAPMDDMGDDMGDEPGINLSEPDALALVDAIVDAIAAETGIEFETSMGGGEEEAPMDADFDAAPADDEGEDLDADLEVMDEDEIVSETLRRVTSRLNAANEQKKIVNEAMRRIQARYGRRK